jgi:hypothetical protein
MHLHLTISRIPSHHTSSSQLTLWKPICCEPLDRSGHYRRPAPYEVFNRWISTASPRLTKLLFNMRSPSCTNCGECWKNYLSWSSILASIPILLSLDCRGQHCTVHCTMLWIGLCLSPFLQYLENGVCRVEELRRQLGTMSCWRPGIATSFYEALYCFGNGQILHSGCRPRRPFPTLEFAWKILPAGS